MSEAKRGREPGFVMGNDHRVKIQNSNILNALMEHVQGIRPMESTQVTAGIALLRKVLPDLQAMTIDGTLNVNPIADLLKEIDGRSRGIPEGD